MSTRSGKRIHSSFHENTMKSETDFTRSERKTRSKHTKDNFDESNASPKHKKRNYVAYPAPDDAGIDTVDSKEEKKTRIMRKNALKERNNITVYVEPAVDTKKPTRSTRKTRKFDENSHDTPEVDTEELPKEPRAKVELPKPKKGKKKKKADTEQIEEKVPKKKSKKKKDRQSGSMVVEDIELEAPGLNKSGVSFDSFHSAAGSPENSNKGKVVPSPPNDIDIVNNSENDDITETRTTRSSMKLDNTLTMENVMEKGPKRRKSSVKVNLESTLNDAVDKENDNQENTPKRELRKRKSSIKDVPISEDKGDKNSDFDMENNATTRKSMNNDTFNKTVTPTKFNSPSEKEATKVSTIKKKRKSTVNETFDANEDLEAIAIENGINATFDKDTVTEILHDGKKRQSVNALIKEMDKSSPLKTATEKKRKSVYETIDKNVEDVNNTKKTSLRDATFNLTDIVSPCRASPRRNKKISVINTTFEKNSKSESIEKKRQVNETFDLTSSPLRSANEVSSPFKRKSVINTTYEKDSDTDQDVKNANTTFDKCVTETKINTTFEKESTDKRTQDTVNSTFDINQGKKLDLTSDEDSKSSLISSDNSLITLDKSDSLRNSINSDRSKIEENILNTTPVLIESSMDESLSTTKTPIKETTPLKESVPITPLKREGTFTKDQPEVMDSPKLRDSKTPTKRMSLPSPGFTPFHLKSSSKEKSVLNVTRSMEKRRSSLAEPSRTTKVMFCSPVNNPAVVIQNRRKVIKSNLKGSNKSFVFDDSVTLEPRPSNRKRSYTHSDADDARVKRKRLAGEMQLSVDRLSRPRTSSASAKLAEPTTPSKKPITPSKKSDAKLPRTKLPNFAALHQKQFDKMESLDECQERKAKRAKQLLTPTGAVTVLERISPKDKPAETDKPKEPPKKPETPIKSLPTFKSLNPGYTRFGFKLNLDVNPFSIQSKVQPKPKENKPNGLTRQATLPSLAGATSLRREIAKQTVMREKSFTDRRREKRTENRTVIKGVRTNRRFELQMRMRDM